MSQGGGRSLEDVRELRRESVLVGREDLPDPETLGDWLRRTNGSATSQEGLGGLGMVRDAFNRRILRWSGIKEYTLMDATFVPGEKRDAHYSYLNEKGYIPMSGFLLETGICWHDEFREGNESPTSGQLAFYEACKKRMIEGLRSGRDGACHERDKEVLSLGLQAGESPSGRVVRR